MADGRKWLWIRAALVTLACALLVVPVVVATALDEEEEPQTASRPPREGPDDSPAPTTTAAPTTPLAPTTTTLAPTPSTTEAAPEEPPPPETEPPHVVAPPPVPAPEAEVGTASACAGGGDVAGLHNAVRCENGLSGLVDEGGLSANAQASANRLLGAGSCEAMTHSDLAAAYAGRSWGENLGCVSSSAGCSGSFGSLMASWMASPGHAANIVNPAYARIGYASACDGHNNYFVVHFTS